MGRSRAESDGTMPHQEPRKESHARVEPEVGTPGEAEAHEEIARRAYGVHLGRGSRGGQDVPGWPRAEAELLHDRGRAAS